MWVAYSPQSEYVMVGLHGQYKSISADVRPTAGVKQGQLKPLQTFLMVCPLAGCLMALDVLQVGLLRGRSPTTLTASPCTSSRMWSILGLAQSKEIQSEKANLLDGSSIHQTNELILAGNYDWWGWLLEGCELYHCCLAHWDSCGSCSPSLD